MKYLRYLAGCVIAVSMPTTLMAQDTETDTERPASEKRDAARDSRDVIVVTARRRKESLQQVPLAVTALSADDLADANLTRMEELTTFVPGVSIAPAQHRNHTPAFAIRGQRQDVNYITNDPSVGIYVAEAVQGRHHGLTQSFFDIESVQILKGPQGTLFGRNTTGGAILIQPRSPTLGEFDGYAQVRLGNLDVIQAQGAVSVPIGEKAGLRLGFNRMVRDGYVRNVTTGNDLNSEDSIALRGVILIEPSDGFKNTTYVDYYDSESLGAATRVTAIRPGSLADTRDLGGGVTLSDIFADQQTLGFFEVEGVDDGESRGENVGVTNVMEIEISPLLTFKNIANYRHILSFEDQNLTGSPLPFLDVVDDQSSHQYTLELQLLGENASQSINWIVGGFYFFEDGSRTTLTSVFGNPPNPRTGTATNESFSVFGQADVEIIENLTVTGGLRYTWDQRDFEQRLLSAATGLCILCESRSADFSALTYTAGLSYEIDAGRLVYFTTRRGYRAGGFNSSGNNAAALEPFDPETITDYELGFKADWALGDATLRTNIAGFYANYNDIQRTVIRTLNNVPVTTIFNAASAHITGFELEANLWLGHFEFIGSLAYIKPVYDDFIDGGIDRSDNTFAHIPEWTTRLGARYTAQFGLGSGSTTQFGIDYAWRDSVFQTEFNAPRNFQESYGLLNARIVFQEIFDTQVDVAVWGSNLTDKEYFQSTGDSFDSSLGVVYRSRGLPRTYGVELSVNF